MKDRSSLSTAAQAADLITTAQTYIHTHTHTKQARRKIKPPFDGTFTQYNSTNTHTHLLMALFLGLPR